MGTYYSAEMQKAYSAAQDVNAKAIRNETKL